MSQIIVSLIPKFCIKYYLIEANMFEKCNTNQITTELNISGYHKYMLPRIYVKYNITESTHILKTLFV